MVFDLFQVNKSKTLTDQAKLYKNKILEMFLEELKESETDMKEAEKGMDF